VYLGRGEPARALELLGQVLQSQQSALGRNHEAHIPVLMDLARVQVCLGDQLAARELIERIRGIRVASPFPDPLADAFGLVCLSDSHRQLNDMVRAASLASQAWTLRAGTFPGATRVWSATWPTPGGRARHAVVSRPPSVTSGKPLAWSLSGWQPASNARFPVDRSAGLEVARGRPRRATPLYMQAAELVRKVQGEDHPDHAAQPAPSTRPWRWPTKGWRTCAGSAGT
jgi:hypothetical protein